MEIKGNKLSTAQAAGVFFCVAAGLLLVTVIMAIGSYFNLQALLMCAALVFLAVLLLKEKRGMLLLAATGIVALMELLFGGLVGFVGALLLLFVTLVMTTEYLPQPRMLVKKFWFVPAIVLALSELIFSISLIALVFAVAIGGGALRMCKWLVSEN